ncbi:hypothetical protein Tco_1531861, partial [Tanacetum coccineum]
KQKSRRPKEKDIEIPQSSYKAVNEEPSMKLKELIDFYTKLQQRVLDLENTKTAQAHEITSLKKRVKKLEKKGGSRTHKLKRLYKVGRSARVVSSEEESLGDQEDAYKQRRIDDIDADKDIYLVNVHRDEDMFRVNDLEDDKVVVESEVADKDVNLSIDEVTLAQALATLKSAEVQEKGDVIKEPSVPVSAASTKKELLKLDEELAFKLQAEEDEEERIAREKAQKFKEANIAWDDIQAKFEADYELAQRLQAQEVNTFVDIDTKLVKESPKKAEAEIAQESSSKRAGEALEQESSKKQKVDDDKEAEELKQCMESISDDGDYVTIEVTPLSIKYPTIVDYKIYKEGKKSYFQIIRADGIQDPLKWDQQVVSELVALRNFAKKTWIKTQYICCILLLLVFITTASYTACYVSTARVNAAGTKVTTTSVQRFPSSLLNCDSNTSDVLANIKCILRSRTLDNSCCEPVDVQQGLKLEMVLRDID